MKYYIISGEASGDLHGANLMKEIKKIDPDAQFRCWGGDLMKEAGGEIVKHIRDLAFMGLIEVIANIRTIKRNFRFCFSDIENWKPDALILVDYPGFNLRVAKRIHGKGIPVHYYISPTVWAWHRSRVYTVRDFVDHMYCILPFEKEFYAKYQVNVEFEGHPLLDALTAFTPTHNSKDDFCADMGLDNRPIIALLPGSRVQEIKRLLPVMLQAVKTMPEYQPVIAGVTSVPGQLYSALMPGNDVKVVYNSTYDLLRWSDLACVTSGTATLETALSYVPQVVCYKMAGFSFAIAKRLVKVRYISLVNLILDKSAVTELIQNDCTPDKIAASLQVIIGDGGRRMKEDYNTLKKMLGGAGASARVAGKIWYHLTNKK